MADVVVIGASLAGLTTALLLAREGVDVVLVDPEAGGAHGLGAIETNVVEHPHRTARALGDSIHELWAFTDRNKEVAAELGLFEPTGMVLSLIHI